MTAHDIDIELPPLPPLYIVPSVEPVDYPEVAQALMDYARAAVEADRKRRGEPGLLMVQEADTIPHFHPEYGPGIFFTEDAVISPRSQQPAEPDEWKLAVDNELTNMQSTADSYPSAKEAVKALIDWHVAVTTDQVFRQPAEPSGAPTLHNDHSGAQNGNQTLQSDEPDLVKCAECGADLIPVRPGKWQHPDCSQSYWADEMVSKTDWNNELSSWSDEDFIRIFHERPDLANRLRKMLAEPVKITCKKCNGTGVERTQFHGVWPNGEECLEPIKCDQCDGFGTTSSTEPVVADAQVPSDESTRKWKRIEEYSREVDGKKIDIYLGDFLLYCPELEDEDEENNGVVIGYYSEPLKCWYTSESLEKVFPTHFMPLPEKPL